MTNFIQDKLAGLKDNFGDRLVFLTNAYPEYFHDASDISLKPSAIIFPDNETEVMEIIKCCQRTSTPIVFRGGGTGYTGGAVPVEKGLLLSLKNLRRLEIDTGKKLAFCGPGIITIELMKAAEKNSLFYPPDPASYKESHLGGNVAENAGGLHCKKYGVTKDYVAGLKAVTIGGELIKTGAYNDYDLFNLDSVLIGSEGLLAAVVEIALRLIDKPATGPTILAAFASEKSAAKAVADITTGGIIPAVMEYMDRDTLVCSIEYEKSVEMPQAATVLLFETDGDKCEYEADQIENLCRKHNASHLQKEYDPEKVAKIWSIRRNLSPAVKSMTGIKISEDIAIPPSKLPEIVDFVAKLNRKYPLRINSFGHAGDGNLHVNFLAQSNNESETSKIGEAIEKLFDKTLELGGTLTGEHGIGLTKKDYLHLEFNGPTIDYMKKVKSVFDIDRLLNPGKMFD